MQTPWVFEPIQRGGKRRDPMEGEFFTGEEDNEQISARTDSLVNEVAR